MQRTIKNDVRSKLHLYGMQNDRGQMAKLQIRKVFTKRRTKNVKSFKIYNGRGTRRKDRRKKCRESSLRCVEVTWLHLFTPLFSSLAVDGGRKEAGSLAGKVGFSATSSSRDKRYVPETWFDAILLRKCFKDLENTEYVTEKWTLDALYASCRTKYRRCRRWARPRLLFRGLWSSYIRSTISCWYFIQSYWRPR